MPMTCSLTVVALACTLLAGRVCAQEPSMTRPDTLGAAFDDQHPGTATPADWEFLAGRWDFRYQQRTPATGGFGPVRTGVWTAGPSHGGAIMEDEFALDAPATGARNATVTYRIFDSAKHLWAIEGVGTSRGVWQPGQAWSDGAARYVVQDNPATGIRLRIRYYAIEKDHFLWRADGSRDGGKTWLRDVLLIEATRAAAPGGGR